MHPGLCNSSHPHCLRRRIYTRAAPCSHAPAQRTTQSPQHLIFLCVKSKLSQHLSRSKNIFLVKSDAELPTAGWTKHCKFWRTEIRTQMRMRQFQDSNSLDSSSPAILNLLIWGLNHSDKVSDLYPVKKRNSLNYILKEKCQKCFKLLLRVLCLHGTQISVVKSKEQFFKQRIFSSYQGFWTCLSKFFQEVI